MPKQKMNLNEILLNIAEKIFLYGEYSEDDFQTEDIQGISFQQCREELIKILGSYVEEVSVQASDKPVLRFKDVTPELMSEILTWLYEPSGAVNDDYALLIILMDILAEENSDSWYSCSALVKKIREYTDNPEFTESASLKKKLEMFVNQGYLISKKNGRSFEYTKSPDIFKDRNEKFLYQIKNLTDFSKNILHPGLLGENLSDIIDIYFKQNGLNRKSLFSCRHQHMGQILEDSSLWMLINAIRDRKTISFRNQNGKKMIHIQPYKIVIQEETGKRYIFCINLKNENKCSLLEIGTLSDLKTEKSVVLERVVDEEAEQFYHAFLDRSFTHTVISDTMQSAILVYHPDFSPEIRKRFPDASPQPYNETYEMINIEVSSLQELKPWLLQNMDKVRIKDCSDDTGTQIQGEINEWRSMYGIK